jgi:hypothetical protein
MQAAGIGQLGGLDFVFVDLKQNVDKLDKAIQKDLNRIEKLIIRTITSRKKLNTEVHAIFPELFNLRLKGLEWLANEKIDLNDALDEVYPSIEMLAENPRLKMVGYHICQALIYNRKLVDFFSEKGVIHKDSLDEFNAAQLDYASFFMALQLIPSQIRRLIVGLVNSSLMIEFLSISSVMINSSEVSCSPTKLIQLNDLAKTTALDYMNHVNALLSMAQAELFYEERNDWGSVGLNSFSKAYGDNEPDYDGMVGEPNPDYSA